MRIVIDRPPMWDAIVSQFPEARQPGVIFCWGDLLFNPSNVTISRELMKHEEVHSERQGVGHDIVDWWEQYLLDPVFRFEEELPAHRAEYRHFCKRHGGGATKRYLNLVAARLSSPLYGSVVTLEEAKERILGK